MKLGTIASVAGALLMAACGGSGSAPDAPPGQPTATVVVAPAAGETSRGAAGPLVPPEPVPTGPGAEVWTNFSDAEAWTRAATERGVTMSYSAPTRSAQFQRIWIKIEFPEPTVDDALSIAALSQVECQTGSIQRIYEVYYTGANLTGGATPNPTLGGIDHAEPGSANEAIVRAACTAG